MEPAQPLLTDPVNPDDILSALPGDIRLHCARVAAYAEILALRLMEEGGIRSGWFPIFRRAVRYHDLGKMVIPRTILLKPGPLTEGEWDIIRRHPSMGARMLEDCADEDNPKALPAPICRMAVVIAEGHHERWDGGGYPRGWMGEEIPLAARICTVADAYDAMTTERCYSPALSHRGACREIWRESGAQFDPRLAELFRDCETLFQLQSFQRGGDGGWMPNEF